MKKAFTFSIIILALPFISKAQIDSSAKKLITTRMYYAGIHMSRYADLKTSTLVLKGGGAICTAIGVVDLGIALNQSSWNYDQQQQYIRTSKTFIYTGMGLELLGLIVDCVAYDHLKRA